MAAQPSTVVDPVSGERRIVLEQAPQIAEDFTETVLIAASHPSSSNEVEARGVGSTTRATTSLSAAVPDDLTRMVSLSEEVEEPPQIEEAPPDTTLLESPNSLEGDIQSPNSLRVGSPSTKVGSPNSPASRSP